MGCLFSTSKISISSTMPAISIFWRCSLGRFDWIWQNNKHFSIKWIFWSKLQICFLVCLITNQTVHPIKLSFLGGIYNTYTQISSYWLISHYPILLWKTRSSQCSFFCLAVLQSWPGQLPMIRSGAKSSLALYFNGERLRRRMWTGTYWGVVVKVEQFSFITIRCASAPQVVHEWITYEK